MSNECGPKFLTPANIYRFFPRDMKYKKSEEDLYCLSIHASQMSHEIGRANLMF